MLAACIVLVTIPAVAAETGATKCESDSSGKLRICRSVQPNSGAAGQRALNIRLDAKVAEVKIGSYIVRTETLDGNYLPPVLALEPGEKLNIHLDNDLPPLPTASEPNAINLHTHGLVVSPKNQREPEHSVPAGRAGGGRAMVGHHGHGGGNEALDGPLVHGSGDNIYVTVEPKEAFDYHIDLPTELTAQGRAFSPHPQGLFWYHPHFHGLAQRQVSAGMASAIVIGSPKQALRRADAQGNVIQDPDLIAKTDEQILILKDIELIADKTPAEIGPGGTGLATWIGLPAQGVTYAPEWQAGFVPTSCADSARDGWCTPSIDPNDANAFPGTSDFAGKGRKIVWLFTVNGELKPTVNIAAGRFALWRIVNTSPSLTYDLQLVDPSTSRPVAKFAVLAVDGTVPGNVPAPAAALAAALPVPRPVKVEALDRLLLLPASRAEILVLADVEAPPNLVLRTVGFRSGAQPPADPDGGELADLWPQADLATVALGGGNVPSGQLYFQPQLTIPTSAAPPVDGPLPAGCVQATLKSNQRRQIVLDSDGDFFLIGSRIVTTTLAADGTAQDTVEPDSWITPQPMPMMGPGAWEWIKHVCVRQGSVETWEIVNRTNEIHNFHIHQNKFTLTPFTPDHPNPIDPNKMLANYPLFSGTTGTDLTAWHDTFPIPPAKQYRVPDPNDATKHIWVTNRDEPGSVRLIINFQADQQVGRFVFHCHILEHEDKGMMAPIEVLPVLASAQPNATTGRQ
jgi:FtsP/CotA-like multicopper oxidase with cupredoxin domain